MKNIHLFFVLFLIGFVVSCSNISSVQYNYDKRADFENLKTYDWMTVPKKADIDILNVERVKKAVSAELQAKGLMMTSNNPDFLIAEHLGKDKVQVKLWGYNYRGYLGSGELSPFEYEEGLLTLDFVDAKSKEVIWRGVAEAKIKNANTPEKKERLINEAVKNILKNFPPKPKEFNILH